MISHDHDDKALDSDLRASYFWTNKKIGYHRWKRSGVGVPVPGPNHLLVAGGFASSGREKSVCGLWSSIP
jgi:hypothetical protein